MSGWRKYINALALRLGDSHPRISLICRVSLTLESPVNCALRQEKSALAQFRITNSSTDPVLPASDFRCVYFGRDLLEMLETIVTFARDHVVPWCRGGSDGTCNRAAACAACDALKAHAGIKSIEHARLLVQLRRDRMATTYLALPGSVRGRTAEWGGA